MNLKQVAALLISFSALGVQSVLARSLEKQAIANFRAHESADKSELHLSGTCAHSAYCVKDMSIKKKGDDLQVILKMVLAKRDLSPSFVFVVPLQKDTRRVLLGTKKAVIWTRTNSKDKPSSATRPDIKTDRKP